MRVARILLLLLAAGCASAQTPPAAGGPPGTDPPREAFLGETVSLALARIEAAIASNDVWLQSNEISRSYAPSYEGLVDQIRASTQSYDVERLRLWAESFTRDRTGDVIDVEVRFEMRRRARVSGAIQTTNGRSRIRFEREGNRTLVTRQDGDPLFGPP